MKFNFPYWLRTNCNTSKIRHCLAVESQKPVDQLLCYSSIVLICFNLVKKRKMFKFGNFLLIL